MNTPGVSTLVFVGPTLPAAEVSARLPGATVMPPVAVGEILTLVRRRGVARIAIIDGFFERMAAVWHKEILVALEIDGDRRTLGGDQLRERFTQRARGHVWQIVERDRIVAGATVHRHCRDDPFFASIAASIIDNTLRSFGRFAARFIRRMADSPATKNVLPPRFVSRASRASVA